MKASLTETIRLHRLRRGLSQENMADLLNLSTTAYGDIERGKTDLTVSRLLQIADLLEVPPADLLTGNAAILSPSAPIETLTAEVVPAMPASAPGLDASQQLLAMQQLEIEQLRREAEHWKRRYEERTLFDLARALQPLTQPQPRERIGF
jgi:XRE family transcriptional regulator, regulator of sulfur utilization